MTTNNGSNAPAWIELGAKAGTELRKADTAATKGEALAIVVLHGAMRDGYEMEYSTPRTKDETDAPVMFTLATYGNNIVSENGKNDSKAITARKAALYSSLFGLVEFTPAQDSVIARALVSAQYLFNNGVEPVLNSKGQLVVPKRLIFPAPAADASDNAKAEYEDSKDSPRALDGKKGTSLRELRNRAVAAQPRKTRKAKAQTSGDNEKDFRTAMKFLASVMQMINTTDEAPVSLKREDEEQLYQLQAGIAAYFVANPLEDEDDARKAA